MTNQGKKRIVMFVDSALYEKFHNICFVTEYHLPERFEQFMRQEIKKFEQTLEAEKRERQELIGALISSVQCLGMWNCTEKEAIDLIKSELHKRKHGRNS